MKNVFGYIEQKYQEEIRIENIAQRLIVNFLNDYRIGFVFRWLAETNQSVSGIADRCGFYNISNFNRFFKKNKECTRVEYRQNFLGIKQVS